MLRFMILAASAMTATGSLIGADARPASVNTPPIITQTADGQPIHLARMVVTATPLPEQE